MTCTAARAGLAALGVLPLITPLIGTPAAQADVDLQVAQVVAQPLRVAAPQHVAFSAAPQARFAATLHGMGFLQALSGPATVAYNTPFSVTLPSAYSGRKFTVTSRQGTAKPAAVRFETSAAADKLVTSATATAATTITLTPTVFQVGQIEYSVNFAAVRGGPAATTEVHTVTISAPTDNGVGVTAAPNVHFVSPNAKFTVSGRITNDGMPFAGTAYAQLEQKFGSEWIAVGSAAKAKADGSYAISAISEDLQTQTSYRVVVPNGPSVAATSLEFTVELGAGKHTSFKLIGARWQPCEGNGLVTKRKIKYGITLPVLPPAYSDNAAAIADIDAAVAKVAQASGLSFEKVSGSQPLPQKVTAVQEYQGGADIVFAFADQTSTANSTLLPATVGKILGVGGYVDMGRDGIADQGYIVLDARQKLAAGLKPSRNRHVGSGHNA